MRKLLPENWFNFQVVIYLGVDWISLTFISFTLKIIILLSSSHGKANVVQFVFTCCSDFHCVKKVHIPTFSGSYFPVFGLNTEIYGVNLRIQSKYRKIQTRKNSVFGHFSRSVYCLLIISSYLTLRWDYFDEGILFCLGLGFDITVTGNIPETSTCTANTHSLRFDILFYNKIFC